jgi:signal transduction histidine kinase/CheY-like chemotaxis protein
VTRKTPAVLLRHVLLVAAAAVPVVLVLPWLRADLLADREAQMQARLRLHASLLGGEISDLLQSGEQLGRAILRLPDIRDAAAGCDLQVRDLLRDLPAYQAITVVDATGQPRCGTPGSRPLPAALAAPAVANGAAASGPGHISLGRFTPATATLGPTLPLVLPFDGRDGTGALVLRLSLDWLANRLRAQAHGGDGAVLTLADAAGTALVRLPDDSAFIGLTLPPAMLAAGSDGRPALAAGLDGQRRITAVVPVAGGGLVVTAAQLPPAGLTGFAVWDRLGGPLAALLLLATLANIWLLVRFNARLDRRPVAALASMTELLARQRAELQQLNATLEARVAARTRDLVASRNQLQLQSVEREKANSELREAQKLQAVGQLAGGIAHDFNNLLGSVTVALEVLRRRLGPLLSKPGQPDIATPLRTAQDSAQRGAMLTGRLLAFARRQRLLPAATDLNRLVAELPGLVAGTLGGDIAIRTELAPGLWPAFIDPGQVEAALLNLVFNARDAMPGGGTLTLATANLLLPDDLPAGPNLAPGAYVAVRVKDTGTGIAPELLARVFEPFFTTKPAGSASGLGLSQVHGVALQSGGDVRIDSEPASGTTVTLLLPRATQAAEAGHRAAPPAGLRILVADDDDAVRRMTGEILAERGHHPVLAGDATQALAILEKDLADTGGSFDVLLSDYVMPGTNGMALILMAQALQPRMHALLVTGHAELAPDDPLRPQNILRKPFTIAALEARLALIRGKAAAAPAA